MSYPVISWMKGVVGGLNPPAGAADGSEVPARMGRMSEIIMAPYKGAYAEQCARGNVWFASAAAVTIPVNANNLVSVFTLYNPPGSGKNLELIDFVAPVVLATTVVDGIGLYYSAPNNAIAGTFTTKGTPQCGLLGGGASPAGQFYSAYTHSGTPLLACLMGGWGAVTDANSDGPVFNFNGKVLIPPGVAASVAMTTAAGTGSGITLGMSWAEHPV